MRSMKLFIITIQSKQCTITFPWSMTRKTSVLLVESKPSGISGMIPINCKKAHLFSFFCWQKWQFSAKRNKRNHQNSHFCSNFECNNWLSNRIILCERPLTDPYCANSVHPSCWWTVAKPFDQLKQSGCRWKAQYSSLQEIGLIQWWIYVRYSNGLINVSNDGSISVPCIIGTMDPTMDPWRYHSMRNPWIQWCIYW